MSKFFDAIRRATEQAGANATPLIPDLSPLLAESAESSNAPDGSLSLWAAEQLLSRQGSPEERALRRVTVRPAASTVLVPLVGHDRRAAEQYRIIRTKIVQHPERPRLLAISSGGVGDGKTVSSINIAAALSLKEKSSVLLVDADFRRSALAEMLGIDGTRGLADILRGGCSVRDAVVQLESYPSLYVLPGGQDLPNAVDLLDSPRWQLACKIFGSLFDFTVIDAPPVGLVADYDIIQASVDAVVLVARTDHTNRARFLAVLESVPKRKLIGVVMNCVPDWFLTRSIEQDDRYYGHSKMPASTSADSGDNLNKDC